MAEKGRVDRVQEQDCLSYSFHVKITNLPPTGFCFVGCGCWDRACNLSEGGESAVDGIFRLGAPQLDNAHPDSVRRA